MAKWRVEIFRIPKQEDTAEFKELALVEQTLRNCVKAAKVGTLHPPGAKTVTPERMELSRARAETARLRMEVEILKKARAHFAKDAL